MVKPNEVFFQIIGDHPKVTVSAVPSQSE